MKRFRRMFNKLTLLFRRDTFDSGLAEEMAFHQEEAERAFEADGMTPEEARHAARRQFGNATKMKEQSHEAVKFWFETVAQDFLFAARQLRKNPAFAGTAILVLSLGIGACVAIFAFVDAALLEPLPYANPNRLMAVNESNVESPRWPLSYPDFLDWQRLNRSFKSLAVYGGAGYILHSASGAEPVQVARVSGGFFQTLGVRPTLGRDFSVDEDRVGGPNVVLLSYGAWLHRFGARSDVVGHAVDLDGRAFTILGVLPSTFTFAPTGNAEFWVPINSLSLHEHSRTFYNFWGVGRLRDGVAIPAAQAEMTAISRQLQWQYGIVGHKLSASVVPLSEVIVGDVQPILLTLMSGAGLLLLIACFNVASLVLVRSENRRREVAVRGALGATPARLVRQFFTEGLLLAGLGSAAGVMVAVGIMRSLGRLVPKDMASNMLFLEEVGLNAHTGAITVAIAVLTVLLLAVMPMARLSLEKVRDGLADGDRGAAGRLWRRLGANMVVIELAITVVLLAGAGLLGRSLYRLLHVPLGFNPNHLATMQVMAAVSIDTGKEQTVGLYREIVRQISGLPGVESAGMTSVLPVQCNCNLDWIRFPGKPYHGEHNEVNERHVSPGYLPTLKATLVRGRFFAESDDASRPRVAVINQALARKYFPGQDPIGQKIADGEGGIPTTWEIVGVVDDVREGPLDVNVWPVEYFPMNQTLDRSFSLAVHTSQDPGAMLPSLVSTLHHIDENLAVSDEATMNAKIGDTQAALLHRFSAWLVGGFAMLALLLSVVGLYGVIAYSVRQRTREIGVRMALGAQRSSIYRMILQEAGRLTLFGIAAGMIGAVAAGMLMRSLLFDIRYWDLPTLVMVGVVLSVAALVATYIPARAAASVNPVEALRAE